MRGYRDNVAARQKGNKLVTVTRPSLGSFTIERETKSTSARRSLIEDRIFSVGHRKDARYASERGTRKGSPGTPGVLLIIKPTGDNCRVVGPTL